LQNLFTPRLTGQGTGRLGNWQARGGDWLGSEKTARKYSRRFSPQGCYVEGV